MIANTTLIRYRLLDIPEENALWLDLESLKIINFATVTDDQLDAIVAKYEIWAADLVEPLLTKKFIVGGPYFNSSTTVSISTRSGVFLPISSGISDLVTNDGDPEWGASYYDDADVVPSPPAPMGILDTIDISEITGITYLGGELPSYLEWLNVSGIGLIYVDFENIPSKCTDLNFTGNALIEASVDNILIRLDENGALDGEVLLDGPFMASPSATGNTAKANLLAKGWTVRTE